MSTYPGFTFKAAREFPLATAFLMARHRADCRADGESPDNPLVASLVHARARVRRWAAEHLHIVPGSPSSGTQSPGYCALMHFVIGASNLESRISNLET